MNSNAKPQPPLFRVSVHAMLKCLGDYLDSGCIPYSNLSWPIGLAKDGGEYALTEVCWDNKHVTVNTSNDITLLRAYWLMLQSHLSLKIPFNKYMKDQPRKELAPMFSSHYKVCSHWRGHHNQHMGALP
jgi:hypothetical protein